MRALLVVFAFLIGCQSAPVSPTGKEQSSLPQAKESAQGQADTEYGPAPPPVETVYGPTEAQAHANSKSVVLVVGPGGARAFALAGIIRALYDSKIKISGIVAAEFGAVISALYAVSSSLNQFEWSLLKLKNGIYESSFLRKNIFKREDTGAEFQKKLEELFGKKEFHLAKVSLRVGIRPQDSKDVLWVREGSITQALRASGAIEGVMSPGEYQGNPASWPGILDPYPLTQAKEIQNGATLVVVDFLKDLKGAAIRTTQTGLEQVLHDRFTQCRTLSQATLDAADIVISPDLKGFLFSDFSRRSEAFFRGKQSILNEVTAIKKRIQM